MHLHQNPAPRHELVASPTAARANPDATTERRSPQPLTRAQWREIVLEMVG